MFGLTPRQMIDLPPVWLIGALAVAWGIGRAMPMAVPAWVSVVGTVLVVTGFALMALAFVEFRRHRTTVVPHKVASALVTTGVYRLSRNPIYLGDVLILTGFCLRWGAYPALALVPAFIAVTTARFIRPEEERLEAEFGGPFRDWAARTRRWI